MTAEQELGLPDRKVYTPTEAGAFIDQTRLQGGTTGSLGSLAGLEGV